MGVRPSRGTRSALFVLSLILLLAAGIAIGFVPALECLECQGSGELDPLVCFARPEEVEHIPCYLCRGGGKMTAWTKICFEARRLQYCWQHRHQL